MAIKDTRRRRSPYEAPEGRIESPEEEYARLENKNQQIRAKLAYQRSEDEFRPIRQAYEREHFDPDQVDEEFEFEEPAVAQVGPTTEEAAEEEAELESGQYRIPGMAPAAAAVAMRAQAPRLTEEADAQLLKDFGPTDKAEPAPTEVSREDTFRGAGNYTYAKTADGDWFFTSPSGKTGVAKKGSKGWESITSESEGKGSLWGTEGFAGSKAEGSGEADGAEESEGTSYADYSADPDAYYGKAEREAKEEAEAKEGAEAEAAPTKRAPAPKNIKGDFSLDSPPPAFSPAKISTFLDQNPQLAEDPAHLGAFIANANYGDRQDAGQAFVDTIRAKAEINSLAMRGRENLTLAEKSRYADLRQVFNYPATMSDRVLGAITAGGAGFAAGLAVSGVGAIPGAIGGAAYGGYNPRSALKLAQAVPGFSSRKIAATSPGTTQRGEVGEDFGALLEAELASE